MDADKRYIREMKEALEQPLPDIRVLRGVKGVKVGVGNGYTIEVEGVYIKPSFYIEAPLPEDTSVEEFAETLSDFVEAVCKYQEARACRMVGII